MEEFFSNMIDCSNLAVANDKIQFTYEANFFGYVSKWPVSENSVQQFSSHAGIFIQVYQTASFELLVKVRELTDFVQRD